MDLAQSYGRRRPPVQQQVYDISRSSGGQKPKFAFVLRLGG